MGSSRVRRLVLTLVFVSGVALRAYTAATVSIQGDERHYVGDACWLTAPMSLADRLRFLRNHPHVHMRLDPATGVQTPWPTTGDRVWGGHLVLHAYVTGVVLRVVGPASANAQVRIGRAVNLAADSTGILLLPRLLTALGSGPVAGIMAAGLYAVFPPAVVYGSLANLDPFLAPLFLASIALVLSPGGGAGRWVVAGVVSGLLLCAKQTGLIVLGVVPLLGWRQGWRRLAAWATTAALVIVLVVNPVEYVAGLRTPSDPYLALRFRPIETVAGNLGYLSQPSLWYCLSYSYHGRPPAAQVAPVHHVLTPAYLVIYALALPLLAFRRRGRALAILYGPVASMLVFIEPSNGVWRFLLAAPLLCAGVALALVEVPLRTRAGVLGVALLAALLPIAPARPPASGTVDLGDLLFMNPRSEQPEGFYPRWRGKILHVHLANDAPLDRRLWLRPGRYQVDVTAAGSLQVALDGRPALEVGSRHGETRLTGWLHALELSSPSEAELSRLVLRRTGD